MKLGDAVRLALQNDPVFLSAQADLDVSRERSAEAAAGLLPQLSATASTNLNRRDYVLGTTGQTAFTEKFNSHAAQLNLTQPVWQGAKRIASIQAAMLVSRSEYQLEAARQDLFVRLAQAWFDLMQARDALASGDAKVRAARNQMEQAVRGNALGLMSVSDVEDARTNYELAWSERAAIDGELGNRQAALEQIIGPVATKNVPILSSQFVPQEVRNDTLEQWLGTAESKSPSILAARRVLDAALEEIRKQRAGHQPTVDIVASYGKSAQGAGISGGQAGFDSRLGTLGLQLNIPLYAGGAQSAKVREAEAARDKAMHELEAARRSTRLAVKQAWYAWQTGQARWQSARQALKSAAFSLDAARSAMARGVKTELDVLQAQQKCAEAQRDLDKARYDMITSYFRLKAAAGQLSGDDLTVLDEVFEDAMDNSPAELGPRSDRCASVPHALPHPTLSRRERAISSLLQTGEGLGMRGHTIQLASDPENYDCRKGQVFRVSR